jgi:hypothetical protein
VGPGGRLNAACPARPVGPGPVITMTHLSPNDKMARGGQGVGGLTDNADERGVP